MSDSRHIIADRESLSFSQRDNTRVYEEDLEQMKPSERLNRSYTLRRTTVQIALDNGLISAPATVTFNLSPRPKVLMECAFTWDDVQATNEIREKGEIQVILENGTSVDVLLGETSIGGGIRLTLIPKAELVTVKEDDSLLTRGKFALINFPSIWGDYDLTRYPDPNNKSRGLLYQRFRLRSHPWLVNVVGVDSVMGVHYGLLRRGGSAITHIGSVVREDCQQFSLDDLNDLLKVLHLFLSFARGSYCGLTYLSGHDADRNRIWEQWGTYEVEPCQRELASWLDPGGSHHLSSIFGGFLDLFAGSNRAEGVTKVIQWYLRGNESTEPEVGVILAHAGLERLSFLVNGPKGHNQLEGDWIAEALRCNSIDPSLPADCTELTALNYKGQWSHGPHLLTVLRNNLVHPDNRSGPFSEFAVREAQSLGLYYIELIILRFCGYTGEFVNRLKGRDASGSRIERVPWAPA